jgi:hypothetical protein
VELGYSLSNLIRPGSEWLRESGFDDAQGKETSMIGDMESSRLTLKLQRSLSPVKHGCLNDGATTSLNSVGSTQ